jgi:hypothetical protein
MTSTYRLLWLGMLVLLLGSVALGQRPRSITEPATPAEPQTRPAPPPAPQEVKVKYEGGIFGYRRKIDGTLFFDDQNRRVVFRDKNRRELFPIPYDAITAAFADTQSKRPTAAGILGGASIYTLPALLIKKKYRYLTLQYSDPDTRASGITSFKMQNKEILETVLNSLAYKAGLTPRGEIYVRRKTAATTDPQASPE